VSEFGFEEAAGLLIVQVEPRSLARNVIFLPDTPLISLEGLREETGLKDQMRSKVPFHSRWIVSNTSSLTTEFYPPVHLTSTLRSDSPPH
jgi:hypothetical protein